MTHEESILNAEKELQEKFKQYLIIAWDEIEEIEFTITEMNGHNVYSVVHILADQLSEAMSINPKEALLMIYNNVEYGINQVDDKSKLN